MLGRSIEMHLTTGKNLAAIASVVNYIARRLVDEKRALNEFYEVFGATKVSMGKYWRNVMDNLLIILEVLIKAACVKHG